MRVPRPTCFDTRGSIGRGDYPDNRFTYLLDAEAGVHYVTRGVVSVPALFRRQVGSTLRTVTAALIL